MSAHVCEPKQIAIVAKAVVEFERRGEHAKALAKKLGLLNVQSVAYRYRLTEEETTLEFASTHLEIFLKECSDAVSETTTFEPERLLGLIGSFLYQSCESDETYHSELYRRVAALEDHMEENGIKARGWSL